VNTQTLTKTTAGRLFAKVLAAAMESKFRYRFFGPDHILEGVEQMRGKTVLEIGCGTGFFTIPAAMVIGDEGSLIAMDILPESVKIVTRKVDAAHLKNVRVIEGDALDTKLESESVHTVLLFGVIPAPMLALIPLLTEMKRVLKPEGNLAVWPPVPGWLPRSILKTGLFSHPVKHNGVYNFRRC
jgi:SAM-dependent methyltransferase